MKEKKLELEINGRPYSVAIKEFTAYEAVLTVDDKTYKVGLKDLGIDQVAEIKPKSSTETETRQIRPISLPSNLPAPALHKPKSVIASPGAVMAPLPGLIQKITVNPGDTVQAGQNLIVMEAMKMENDIAATRDGIIRIIHVKVGDSVNEGDILIELE